jgi:hypothetical protein
MIREVSDCDSAATAPVSDSISIKTGVYHRSFDRRSMLTFMIYLTDGEAFSGGDTEFFADGPSGSHHAGGRGGCSGRRTVSCCMTKSSISRCSKGSGEAGLLSC